MTICVIPAFRAAESIVNVVQSVLPFVDKVIVVDDFCPQECGLVATSAFRDDPRVEVLRHQANRGVGGAMKSGFRRAVQLGAKFVVKVDADGQMDSDYIPEMLRILSDNPRVALVKGNRFLDSSVARIMPGLRLFGNSILTLFVRTSSGYWNSIDPTNGFLAMRGNLIERLRLNRLADRYFFEISLLCRLGMLRAEIAEIDMVARYGDEPSSLSIVRAAGTFPSQLGLQFARRIIWQYIISDMNVGSLFLVAGILLTTVGAVLGGFCWIETIRTGIARTPGTIGLVFVPLFMGFQLLLNAILYDVQCSPRVLKFNSSVARGHNNAAQSGDSYLATIGLEASASKSLSVR